MKILETQVEGLVDTGAEVTLCSEELWRKITKVVSQSQIKPRRDVTEVDFFAERKIGSKGEVILPLMIDNVNVYQRFMVVRELSRDIILGKDMLTSYNAWMDIESGEVSFDVRGVSVGSKDLKAQETREKGKCIVWK